MVRPPPADARLSWLALVLVACAPPRADPIVAVGVEHTCALEAGALRCWGSDERSQLGRALADLPPLVYADAGGHTTCAVTVDGAVYCFGHNHHGQLGDGTRQPSELPRRVSELPPVSQVSVGYAHACARTDDGAVCCWGWNGSGQAAPARGPEDVMRPACRALDSVLVRAGYHTTCSIDARGRGACFGAIPLSRVEARDVAVGLDHVCLLSEAALTCHGAEPGAFGDAREQPMRQSFEGGGLAAGALDHLCVTDARGALHCVGENMHGQLGDGSFAARRAPVRVRGLPRPVSSVGVGDRHTCAAAGGRVWCWGWNDQGQVDHERGVHSLDPVVVDLAATSD